MSFFSYLLFLIIGLLYRSQLVLIIELISHQLLLSTSFKEKLSIILRETALLIDKRTKELLGYASLLRHLISLRKKDCMQICDNRKVAILQYERLGQTYRVYLPYNFNLSTKMAGHRAFLKKDSKLIDITQQAGIKYLVTAQDLAGEYIEIRYREGTIRFYGNDPVLV